MLLTRVPCLFLATFAILCQSACAELWNVQVNGRPCVSIRHDFVAEFDRATVSNSLAYEAGMRQVSGKAALPGIFLHTVGEGDSIAAYEAVELPGAGSTFLVFCIGFRDNIPWDEGRANGARFAVVIDGQEAFEEEWAGVGWRARAINLAPWSGKAVTIEFRTNAIDGNTNYDWALFGEPLLVGMPTGTPATRDGLENGLALVGITCEEPSSITVTMGDLEQRASFAHGMHWIPFRFLRFDEPMLQVDSGSARLETVLAGPFDSRLSLPEVELSSPLVTAGMPVDVQFSTKNLGRGSQSQAKKVDLRVGLRHTRGGERIDLSEEAKGALGGGARETHTIDGLRPGESYRTAWEGLVFDGPVDRVWCRGGPATVEFHVFRVAPATPGERPDTRIVETLPDGPIAAVVGNPWARLCFVRDTGGASYGIAETWNGAAWQRVGSLYPLARVEVIPRLSESGSSAMSSTQPRALDVRVVSFELVEGALVARAEGRGEEGAAFPVTLTFTPDAREPRIAVQCEMVAPTDTALAAFYGPTVLAGDRAFGEKKDFAFFPGLEYLEGDEESSSERDLVYPLSDRRVPSIYKLGGPIMAVQGDDALVALLWDANSEWAQGERHPAARFLAPKYDSGARYVHMSTFAPSVGEYVRENRYAADENPYPLKEGERLTLENVLVLDHARRYPPESVVHGPHRGGLVLQAMRHYYEAYGFPQPSAQPRDWEAERDLCRNAYANAVWQEEPPGWRHCANWDAGLLVGHAVPQLLDLRAGMAPETRGGVEDRVGRVIERVIRERGGRYLWRGDGCHIVRAELPYLAGYLPESLKDFRQHARDLLKSREDGKWVWHPPSERHEELGPSGGHTLGQAAYPAWMALRAARLTGDPELAADALEAMRQMALYEVPRGAQMWECPMYQPDILAAAHAIRAYCEAYRITGDAAHLEQAHYWAWTGLPFLYSWEMEGYPTMLYNTISVIGSTFYSHSWLGQPVVWCGLVYAYALQDFAEMAGLEGLATPVDWRAVAQGITSSAMWQQYAKGPHQGCYPDSWYMPENRACPADINPENILVNEFRLRGITPAIRCVRIERPEGAAFINAAADVLDVQGSVAGGRLEFKLEGAPGFAAYATVSPVPKPLTLRDAGRRVADSEELVREEEGWLYDEELRVLVIKAGMQAEGSEFGIRW